MLSSRGHTIFPQGHVEPTAPTYLPTSELLSLLNSQAGEGPDLRNEVLVLLHEAIQVILVLVDAFQEVRPLKLQPVQLFVHLQRGRGQ